MTINEMQNVIIEDFEIFDNWFDKYTYLISMADKLPRMPSCTRTDVNLIKECQGKLWIYANYHSGKIQISVDSDILIVRAIAYLIISVLSGRTKEDIEAAELYFIKATGLEEHLDKNRANGLFKMLDIIKSV